MTVSMPDLKRILCSGLLMPVLAVPLLLLFFPILPRTQLPLWHFFNPPTTRTTGYSDAVEPGSQSSITESRTLAFRAEMEQQGNKQLYWRGTVFNRTDGNKWTRISQIPSEQVEFDSKTISQVIYPEPSSTRVLFALDRPAALNLQRLSRSPDGVFELSGNSGRRVSYRADSQTNGLIAQHNSINRPFYLQLPANISIRVKNLATAAAKISTNDRSRVEYLENYFRNGGFRYSTKGLVTGDKAIEQFLFDKKQGHCEFFASSFALLLRAAGVPCRLVGGFLGGEYNQLGGYYLLTDDKAHVWVEAFLEGSGWVRIDPSSFATNAGDVWTPPGSRSLKLRISLALDSFNHAWNRSVITYDFEQQMNVVNHVGSRLQGVDFSKILHDSVLYITGGILLAGLLFAAKRSSFLCSSEERILRRFLRTVEDKFNVTTNDGKIGLFEIALAADNGHVSEFVAIYAGAVYHDRTLTDDERLRLEQILRIMTSVEPNKT